jgi:hypothetical protein
MECWSREQGKLECWSIGELDRQRAGSGEKTQKINTEHGTSNVEGGQKRVGVAKERGAGSGEGWSVGVLECWSGKKADKMRSVIGRKGGDKHRTPNVERRTSNAQRGRI